MKNSESQAYPTYSRALAHGLTKREYFAGLAMQGPRAHYGWAADMSPEIARVAVLDADALLAELAKPVTHRSEP